MSILTATQYEIQAFVNQDFQECFWLLALHRVPFKCHKSLQFNINLHD